MDEVVELLTFRIYTIFCQQINLICFFLLRAYPYIWEIMRLEICSYVIVKFRDHRMLKKLYTYFLVERIN